MLYGLTNRSSLISFDADFSVSVCTLVVFGWMMESLLAGNFPPLPLIFLALLIPSLKTSGFISILFLFGLMVVF